MCWDDTFHGDKSSHAVQISSDRSQVFITSGRVRDVLLSLAAYRISTMILSKSGVTREQSSLIDEVNLHDLLGKQAIMQLSTAFYSRVFSDEQAWFRDIFAGIDKNVAIRNQYEWLVQRLGGPALFSDRKGHPGLMWRHNTFAVTESAAARWLEHMDAALDEVIADADAKQRLTYFFRHMAYFLAEGLSKPGGPACPFSAAHAAARSAAQPQHPAQALAQQASPSPPVEATAGQIESKIGAMKQALFDELTPERMDVTWVDDRVHSASGEGVDGASGGDQLDGQLDQGHFNVMVVLDRFAEMPLLERQRTVLQVLAEHLGDCAVSVQAKTPQQWERWVLTGSWA